MEKGKKVVLVPRLHKKGGVANFCSSIKPFISNCYSYIYRGSNDKSNLFRIFSDYLKFYKYQTRQKVEAIIINTSLGIGGYYRDSVYFLITKNNIKKIILYHGWNDKFEKKINNNWLIRNWFKFTFLKADHILVLSSTFKEKLIAWGYEGEISLYTTLVDDNLLKDFDHSQRNFYNKNILFLSRLEEDKGILEAIESVSLIQTQHDLYFHIAGEGGAMPKVKKKIGESDHSEVFNLLGYVRNEDKVACFKKANLFILPSVHGEGMPISILEAIAFGLPIITTRVGGVPDFFEEGKMGLFLDNRDPEHIAEKIEYLLDRPELMEEMSHYNYEYAKEHFYASKVALRLENIIDEVCAQP